MYTFWTVVNHAINQAINQSVYFTRKKQRNTHTHTHKRETVNMTEIASSRYRFNVKRSKINVTNIIHETRCNCRAINHIGSPSLLEMLSHKCHVSIKVKATKFDKCTNTANRQKHRLQINCSTISRGVTMSWKVGDHFFALSMSGSEVCRQEMMEGCFYILFLPFFSLPPLSFFSLLSLFLSFPSLTSRAP